MPLSLHTLDVFTTDAFGGNPLGVVPESPGLSTAMMQRIAAELALSETVFVEPPSDPTRALRRLRIFTPAVELPFAGHPTIGTAILLADLGVAAFEGATARFVLEEKVGPVPVTVTRRKDGSLFAMLTAATLPTQGPPPPDPATLATALGLTPRDIVTTELGARAYSAGWPYLIIPLRDRSALARAEVNLAAWRQTLSEYWAPSLYLITRDTGSPDVQIRARMFGPALGIPEDPATGAAALDLIGYLFDEERPGDGTHRWQVDQGIEMGRPSRLTVEADVRKGLLTEARLGGTARRMIDGVLRLD